MRMLTWKDPLNADGSVAVTPAPDNWLEGWEIWDRDANCVRTMISGLCRWAAPSWIPKPTTRFYPFFLLPIIMVLCVVGAFGLSSRIFDVWTIVFFGLLGYGFVKGGIPPAPFIIGFILGPMAETNFRRGLMLSDGSFMGFLTSPISGSFLGLAVAVIVWHLVVVLRGKRSETAEILRA